MMNAGCFLFEVSLCPGVQSVPVGSLDVRSCVIMVCIAMIILIIPLIDCAEVPLIADMTESGEMPEQDSCERILSALSAARRENSHQRLWSIISFRIAVIPFSSGTKITGSPFAETAMVSKRVWGCKNMIRSTA